jgi:hypothetical protein
MVAVTRLVDEVTDQVVEGILIRPDGKGVFLMEVMPEESKMMPTQVTAHPVEDGSQVSDHIILKNKMITAGVIISDASFTNQSQDIQLEVTTFSTLRTVINNLGFIEQFIDNPRDADGNILPNIDIDITTPFERDVAANARLVIEEIRDNRELLTLRTSIGDIENVVIRNVKSSRNSTKSNRTFEFTVELEQIQVVNQAATVSLVEVQEEVADEAATQNEYGKQGTRPTDDGSQLERFARITGIDTELLPQ